MSFIWNGVSSDTMKFNVTSRQVYNAPAFDLNAVEVPGRSGDLLNPQNRFKNKQVSYTGFLKASDFEGSTWREKLSTGLIQLKGWLCSDAGNYHELTDDYDPGFTRYGYISGETAISDIEDRPFGVTLTVTFNCKPFMYKAGEPMELPEVKTVGPAAIASFSDGAQDAPLKSAIVNIEPVQSGSGDPSPTNIRPISGWTQVKVTRAGVNLFDKATGAKNLYVGGAGGTTTGAGGTLLCFYAKKGVQYTINMTGGNRTNLYYYDGSVSDIVAGITLTTVSLSAARPYTFIADRDGTYCYYADTNYQQAVADSCTVNVGSTAQPYAAPTLTPITIPLGRTVYGGTLDVVRGKLNVKPYYASYSGQTLVGPWISSHDKYVAGATPTTGAQVVDMGAAGTEYDVTPQTVKTLLGVNNIWADAGKMSIEYPIPTENPYPFGSRPLYEITMAGTGTLVVNGKEWTITDYTGTLYCDTEAMEWYDASQLRNNIVSGDGWPVFEAGENSVSYTGDITKVMVTPRWRTL